MSNSHISPQEYQAQLASNKMKTYPSLVREMHKLHKLDTDDGWAQAVRIAQELISHADLPLYFRCRALLILSTSTRTLSDLPLLLTQCSLLERARLP